VVVTYYVRIPTLPLMVSPDHLEGIKKQASHEACFFV